MRGLLSILCIKFTKWYMSLSNQVYFVSNSNTSSLMFGTFSTNSKFNSTYFQDLTEILVCPSLSHCQSSYHGRFKITGTGQIRPPMSVRKPAPVTLAVIGLESCSLLVLVN